MRITLTLVVLALLCSGCKKVWFDGPNHFEDDFETYSALSDLLVPNDVLWSFTQLTNAQNSITIDTTNAHSGSQSLRFFAAKSTDDQLSKCSIAKHNMAFWNGEVVRLSAWYLIEGIEPADWLFLFDLEEQTAIGAGPGIRLVLVNNQLRMEYKFNERDIVQTSGSEIDFPRNEWVELVWEVKLSQKNEGYVKVWQNGVLIIDSKDNRTVPKDILYSLQGTKGMYSSVEMGATANSRDSDASVWVDDVHFERVK